MYVILTSKPGQFRTELGEALLPVEAYDYIFCGRKRAHFVIAELKAEAKITIVDESSPPLVNRVPSKFLPKFETVEQARHELEGLMHFGDMDISLVKR
ncbi:MAG: ferredoxin [Betaproteobacteria bacterium]|nr:ferredoxin [Betaproteobacteria bacterium]